MSSIDEFLNGRQYGEGLTSEFYTNVDLFKLDTQRIYGRNWLFVGHVSEIPHEGDFLVFRVASESVICVRSKEKTINAFLNFCRHRGSPLCLDNAGHVNDFICPYHAWVYDLSGRLLSAKRMGENFNAEEYSLFTCRVEIENGLIFVCLADEAPSFHPIRTAITKFIAPHGLHKARVCHTLTQQIAANWKIVAENSWECYHCPSAHRSYCHAMPYSRTTASVQERETQAILQRDWENLVREQGHLTGGIELIDGGMVWCHRYPLHPKYVTQSLDGLPVASLMGTYREYDRGVTLVQIFPAHGFSICNDYALLQRILPISPALTEVKYYWLVDEGAREGSEYDLDRLTAFWRITAEEDLVLCENTQKGVSSSRYRPGPFAEVENDVRRFTDWYLSQMRSSL